MPLVARLLIPLEALVCFGPLAAVLFLGLLVSPVWLMGIDRELETLGDVASLTLDDGGRLWPWVYPLLCVVLGVIGVVGLISTVIVIVVDFGRPCRLGVIFAKSLGFAGFMAILLFNYPWVSGLFAGDIDLNAFWPFLFYLVLPIGASIHFWSLLSRRSRSSKPNLHGD